MDMSRMRMVLVAGVLVAALLVAVVSAVNAECPYAASGVAAGQQTEGGPAG
jgi:hypothetical protein